MKGAMWRRFPRRRATFDLQGAHVRCETRAYGGGPGRGPRLSLTFFIEAKRRIVRVSYEFGEADVAEYAGGPGLPIASLPHVTSYADIDQHVRDEAARWLRALRSTRRAASAAKRRAGDRAE